MIKKIVTFFTVSILLISFFLLLFPPVTAADDFVFGTNIQVNDDSGAAPQKTPDIAITSNGNIYCVWADERSSSNPDIHISKSTDDGRLFGDGTPNNDVRVDSGSGTSSQREPAIATYNNEVYVVWQDDRDGYYHIYFAKSTDNGATFSTNKQVDNLKFDVVCQYPDIAVDQSGNIYVVWQAKSEGNSDVYYSDSEDGGDTWKTSVRVDSQGALNTHQKYPKIAVGTAGDRYIAWQDNRSGGMDYDIFVASASAGNYNFKENEVRVNDTSATAEQSRVAIAAYGASDVYVVWHDERASDSAAGDIYFDKSTDKGATFGTDVRVDDQSAGSPVQDRPAIAVDNDGTIHVVWEDKRGGSDKKIYYSNSTDGGSTFGTNLRVDDSGSQNHEHHEPTIAAQGTNKVYVAWKDDRNGNNDIYFSKWGKAGEMGYPPKLINGRLKDGDEIGGINEQYTYEVTYKDLDNEAPAAGYPKLYVYTEHSKSNQISGSPFEMNELDPLDVLYSDGKAYSETITLTEAHEYAFMFEAKAIKGDQSIQSSALFYGPKIDVTPPIFYDPSPTSDKWSDSESVDCSITISDQDGIGIDPTKILYQYLKNGTNEWSRFYLDASCNPVGNTYRCTATVTLNEGVNYIRWNATDAVASGQLGYNWSEAYEVKVDTVGVSYTNPVPPEVNWQNTKHVTCGVTINDFGGSGVNGSSIQYYYKTSDLTPYKGPNSAAVDQNGKSLVVTTPTGVPFENGNDNYIKWAAEDMAGNFKYSDEYVVLVDDTRPPNTPPTPPTEIKPTSAKDPTPRITWSGASDADYDILEYYIQIGTHYDGDDIMRWNSTGTAEFYVIKDADSLSIGTYFVQVRAYDGLDYSLVYQSIMNITASGNSPPTPVTAIYPNVTSDSKPEITWAGAEDPDNDSIKYSIQIGTGSGLGDILSFEDNIMVLINSYTPTKSLLEGIYFIQIQAFDGSSGSSAIREETLKVAKFNPEIKVNNILTITKGTTSATFEINLKNNCSMTDNITIKASGELTTKSSVSYSITPSSPISMAPKEEKDIKLKLTLPTTMSIGSYGLTVQAFSEDGETESFSYDLTLDVKKGDIDDGGDGDGDGDGAEDGDSKSSDLGSLLPIIIVIIIIIVVILVIAAVVSSQAKKKRLKQEESEFFHKKDEYEKLYGPKNKY